MVKSSFQTRQTSIRADVIVLGCSLPGIVTAHKLKKKFGKSMEIVVLDLSTSNKNASKGNVVFEHSEDDEDEEREYSSEDLTARQIVDNIAKQFLSRFARDFKLPLPDAILNPTLVKSPLYKLFQYGNGNTVQCQTDYHCFDYLSVVEKFELNQFQDMLDQNARDLFQANRVSSKSDRQNLLYYDQTSMEKHICHALFFSTSREIMRTTVSLICGVPAHSVSVLFYLHQCHRTATVRNHLDGNNTRFREKLLGHCRKIIQNKLQQSVSDITYVTKPIREIRSYSDEQVILKTIKGDTNYICNLLAMALKPDELIKIRFEEEFLSQRETEAAGAMSHGKAKKFLIQYDENFWERDGYSGDILSVRGPIMWAMERPRMSTTGSLEKYAGLIGYLIVRDDKVSSETAVLEQLTKLFGEQAATPVNYKETDISDVFVPRCGDYVAIRQLSTDRRAGKMVEWGAMDVFADGDVAGALEAGHNTYLHLLTSLRPQAQTFEDVIINELPTILDPGPLTRWASYFNYISTLRIAVYTTAIYLGIKAFRYYMHKIPLDAGGAIIAAIGLEAYVQQ